MDLTRPIVFRFFDLNDVTHSPAGNSGCTVTKADYGEVELKQFVEPKPLADGLDIGGVWQGKRTIHMEGVVYGLTRGEAFDKLRFLEDLMMPTAEYIADPTTFGYAWLFFYRPTGNAGDWNIFSVECMSQGLRYTIRREMFGGDDLQPLAIPWAVTFVCRNPLIS